MWILMVAVFTMGHVSQMSVHGFHTQSKCLQAASNWSKQLNVTTSDGRHPVIVQAMCVPQ